MSAPYSVDTYLYIERSNHVNKRKENPFQHTVKKTYKLLCYFLHSHF